MALYQYCIGGHVQPNTQNWHLFATMSSDELKKDKHHQRKISFTALVFLYYIIVIKAPT